MIQHIPPSSPLRRQGIGYPQQTRDFPDECSASKKIAKDVYVCSAFVRRASVERAVLPHQNSTWQRRISMHEILTIPSIFLIQRKCDGVHFDSNRRSGLALVALAFCHGVCQKSASVLLGLHPRIRSCCEASDCRADSFSMPTPRVSACPLNDGAHQSSRARAALLGPR